MLTFLVKRTKCNEAFRDVYFLRIRKKVKVKSRLRSRSVRSRPRIQRSLMLVENRRKLTLISPSLSAE